MRMRRRRVERCLLRASVAIEAGVLDDAREAIDEVRRLDPDEPGLEPLTAQLAAAENPPSQSGQIPLARHSRCRLPAPAPRRVRRPGHHRFAAAAVLLAGSAAGGWLWPSTFGTTPLPLAGGDDDGSARRPASCGRTTAILRCGSVRPRSPPRSARSRPRRGDAPIATSGLAAHRSHRAQPDVRAAEDSSGREAWSMRTRAPESTARAGAGLASQRQERAAAGPRRKPQQRPSCRRRSATRRPSLRLRRPHRRGSSR